MTLSWWLIRSFSFAEEATWMSASLCQMLVTLGRPGESLHQPRGQGQSLPFNGGVVAYICRLPSLCVVSWEEGGACTPNPWEIHAQPRFEIRVFTMVGRNCLSVVSDVQLWKNFYLDVIQQRAAEKKQNASAQNRQFSFEVHVPDFVLGT